MQLLDQRAVEMVKEVMPKVPDELRDRDFTVRFPIVFKLVQKQLAWMDDLYPPIEPAQTGWLEVGSGHRLYFEVCGHCAGRAGPVPARRPRQQQQSRSPPLLRPGVLLASSCSISAAAGARRPAGRPAPTRRADLIDDIERLREHLGVERWLLFGGSWGSTLALAYAAGSSRSA